MSSTDPDPGAGPPTGGARLSAVVAAELREVFARAGAPDAPSAVLRRPSAVAALRPGQSGLRPVVIAAAAVAGLAGLAAGAFVVRSPAPRTEPTPAPSPQAAAKPAPIAPAPSVLAQAGPAAPALSGLSSSDPSSSGLPSSSLPPLNLPAASDEAPAAAPAARVKAPAPTRAAKRRQVAGLSRSKPVRASTRAALPPPSERADCARDAYGEDCRVAVIQADRRLRAAYARAVRDGVPRGVLIDYRDRWADLRERETDRPHRLVEGYGALADELGREPHGPRYASAGRGPSPLKELKDILVPWW